MATELQQLSPIKGAKVLMVGAGGIGCELLKTLALSGFEDIHIATKYMVVLKNVMAVENNYLASIQIDMDTIEVSNLNRQFLFRQSHVGQSKAKVARDAVLRFRPHINITPYHANVKDPDFKVDFFRQFNVVLNGLDDLDARGHVNRLCLAASVPLIESGTTGFLGQVTVHVKGRTECYECQSKPAPKTYPVHNLVSSKKFTGELNQREQEGQLDEGFLSEVNAQLRQAKEDGDKPGLEAMLQKVYQLYASRVLSKRSYAKKGNEVLKAEQFLETLIQASEAEWNSILIDGLKIGKGDISPEELDGVIKKRIERTLIRTEGGSYQQRVLIEYLKGIQARAEDVVRVLQGKTR